MTLKGLVVFVRGTNTMTVARPNNGKWLPSLLLLAASFGAFLTLKEHLQASTELTTEKAQVQYVFCHFKHSKDTPKPEIFTYVEPFDVVARKAQFRLAAEQEMNAYKAGEWKANFKTPPLAENRSTFHRVFRSEDVSCNYGREGIIFHAFWEFAGKSTTKTKIKVVYVPLQGLYGKGME